MQATFHPRCKLDYYTLVFASLGGRFRKLHMPPEGSNIARHALKMNLDGARIVVYTGDHSGVDDSLFEWADRYYAVNASADDVSAGVIPLGPLFGIKLWNRASGAVRALRAALAGEDLRSSLGRVRIQQASRPSLDQLSPAPPSDGRRLFCVARRWSPNHPEADGPRQRFFAAAGDLPVAFEGGFTDDGSRLANEDYIERLRQSAFAFNCPAVHRCHGWKLGEYLALGKAILSTPLSRELPAPLIHGEHIHVVDDTEAALRSGAELLLADHDYRRQLEVGARAWYEEYIAPEALHARLTATA